MNKYYITFFIVTLVILITLIKFTKETFSEMSNKNCDKNNVDCGTNFQYLKNMCMERRINNKEELCNSIVDIVPRPHDKYNPSNFTDF